ncbi:hypothetical protein [Desulfomonile tiedjei]|uniref:Uncharacterized protein n=1 Tax=Desulfomonile tiedjei (strain ATCC 49306 / DSM 6799 / DCB-1) TaxID=706587 RepID=I4C9E5_DESTA|nr:hypothetical protein [Desulfomonile tiedjei]AFM26186.1 hypothetical protein Desti_3536 [Desulfomonile tiedjei DSM 6799]
MRISNQNTSIVLELVAKGENLDPNDLQAFYQWIDDSYNALEFDQVQKRRFAAYCRSSLDSPSMRIYVGVWILKLSIWEASQELIDHQERLTLTETVLSRATNECSHFSRRRVK